MALRWAPAVVLLVLLTGCESTTAGHGRAEAVPAPASSTPQGLPVPDDPADPATTSAAPAPATTLPTTTPPRTSPAGRPCPAGVAATLPDSQPATLVTGFLTSRFRLYFCRTVGGQLYYRGISRANATQATTLAARTIPGGYEARNVAQGSEFVYRVAQGRLVVTKDGKQILVDPVIGTL